MPEIESQTTQQVKEIDEKEGIKVIKETNEIVIGTISESIDKIDNIDSSIQNVGEKIETALENNVQNTINTVLDEIGKVKDQQNDILVDIQKTDEKINNINDKFDNFVAGSNIDVIQNLDPVDWEKNTEYSYGMQVRYQGNVYIVIQSHKSQANWTPDVYQAGFALIATSQDIEDVEEGKCPDFVQPTSTTPYKKDDCVVFEGKTYISLIDNNIWSPTGYPNGWKLKSD